MHRHLDDQLYFLDGRDAELHRVILSIQVEEIAHLRHAEERMRERRASLQPLHDVIYALTDMLIWLSTWGDSRRMARALKAAGTRPS